MTEVKKRRGRPPKKRDPITKEPVREIPSKEELLSDSPPIDGTEANAAANEILKAAERRANEIVLQSEPDVSGVSPTTDASTDPGQADFIPGTRPPDKVYLPERIYDENSGHVRPCALKKEYHYCFVEASKITEFRINGYRMCLYDGGSQSGLAPGGLRGTHLYERTIDNHIRHGDTFLMYVPMRAHEAMVQEERERIDAFNRVAEDDFHNKGYADGVRTFKEVDGVKVSN